MHLLGASIILFVLLILSVASGINLLIPLVIGILLFGWIAFRKGFSVVDIFKMMISGTEGILLIVQIFILIGAITSCWMAAGTISAIGYYGLIWMNPRIFILFAFLMSSMMSFLLGTAFGTAGTIGVVLLVMAKSAGVAPYIVGGAVIAGAYFGDRCSPMSSSANLISVLTCTDLYINVKNMLKTLVLPFAASIAFYFVVSLFNPLDKVDAVFLESMRDEYRIGIWAFLPALLLFVAAAFRIKVKHAMFLSVLAGGIVAVLYQGETFGAVLGYIMTGYSLSGEGMLSDIMKSGGIVSMINISFIVLISAAYSGILDKARLMEETEGKIKTWMEKSGPFTIMICISVFASIIGCTQTLAIIIVFQLMKNQEPYTGKGREQFALDIENSVVLIAPLIPWNIAGAVPAESIGVSSLFIPFAFFLYMLPIYYLLKRGKNHGVRGKKSVV
ncbi:MAG: Na+/H+ antiporter NhaC family protein [Peptostreptococcaceae bacterium]|nr:Na+/H+ antiporter NhaC family protein [Peptostreptococcaceae bacterium]